MHYLKNNAIILFDGICNLCNSSVNFVIKHDTKKQFIFASLQSDAAKDILLQFGIINLPLESIILIENNKIYKKSTAVLRIAKQLNNGIQFSYVFILIPKFIRDAIYNFIGKYRYQWFGKKHECMIPSKELKNRFIE